MGKKPLKKSLKKIAKFSFLILVKEIYFLLRNLIGLIYHPFLTLRRIKKNKDKSQTFLIFLSLFAPSGFFLFLTGAGVIASKFISLPAAKTLKFLALFANTTSFIFLLFSIFYLFYWAIQVIKKNHFFLK